METVIEIHDLLDLQLQINEDGWGPIGGEVICGFENVPYAAFDKKDHSFRAATTALSTRTPANLKLRHSRDTATEFTYKHDTAEEKTYQLVDNSKAHARKTSTLKKTQQKSKFQQRTRQTTRLSQDPTIVARNKANAGARSKNNRPNFARRNDRKQDRTPSLQVNPDWRVVEEFELADLTKLTTTVPQGEDLKWCGSLQKYEESNDVVSVRSARTLKRSDKAFFSVTSSEDPIISNFAGGADADVYATDSIVSHLMAAPRSVYSWDIVAEKIDGMVFLDKRDDSMLDLLTVSETAQDPPTASPETEEYNHPNKLACEATAINQNFSQHVLSDKPEHLVNFEPNPFLEDEEEVPASVAYRYRRFTMGNIRLITRCEIQAYTLKGEEKQYVNTYALNEWDSKFSGGVNWRSKLGSQTGAVLASELKNNSCKVAKWTAQALMSEVNLMKLGYVSRTTSTNPVDHQILGTQTFRPKELALQINLDLANIWGIIKTICMILLDESKPDGRYVLMKDPNKPLVRIYAVPDEEEGEEDVAGEEDEEEA